MNRFIHPLLFLTLILGACSSTFPATDAAPLAPETPPPAATESTPETFPDSPALPIPRFISTVSTPHIDQSPLDLQSPTPASSGGCGYQWAYKDMPELNPIFDEAIKQLDPNAKAWATAFGEDCIYADGHADFSALETDFYVHKPANDLNDFESFGVWIVDVMKALDTIPPDLITGAQPGFVEFSFIKSEGEHIAVRVPIQTYRDEATGKDGEELFRMFYAQP